MFTKLQIVFLVGLACSILAKSNSNQQCLVNEEWKECGGCEPSCAQFFPACSLSCTASKCECKKGFYRSAEGNCVSLQQCSVENDPCAKKACPAGTVCLNWRRTCIRMPCRVGAHCVKLSCLE